MNAALRRHWQRLTRQCGRDVLTVLAAADHPLTAREVAGALQLAGRPWAEGTVRDMLRVAVNAGAAARSSDSPAAWAITPEGGRATERR